MGLFDFKIGNKDIDQSISLRENINNTILENITNSTFSTKVGSSIAQRVIVDCTDTAITLIKAYEKNPSWGPPPNGEEISKLCSVENIKQIAEVTLNVNVENIDSFATEMDTNIKRDFQQMEDKTEDKDWVSMGIGNTNINKSQNIKKIIDNLKKSNIKNIVRNAITTADIVQEVRVTGAGKLKDVQNLSKIAIVVSAISEALFKDVDKLITDEKISQLTKDTKTDKVSTAIKDVFQTYIKTAGEVLGSGIKTAGTVAGEAVTAIASVFKTLISAVGIIWVVIIGAILAVFLISPKMFCIPPASFVLPFCSSSFSDNSAQETKSENLQNQQYQQPLPQYQQVQYQQPLPQYPLATPI